MQRAARPLPLGPLVLAFVIAAVAFVPDVQAQSRTRTSGRQDTEKKDRVERQAPRRSAPEGRTERRTSAKRGEAQRDEARERRRPERESGATIGRDRTRREGTPRAVERDLRTGTERERTTRTTRTSGARDERTERRREPRVIDRRERTQRRDYREDWREERREYRRETHYDRPSVRVRPYIHIDIDWPWEHRRQRGWAPRYQYRQVVFFEAGWGRHHRDARIDVRTDYRHRVRSANRRRAVVDIYVDRIALYEDGYFLGAVDRIPERLGRIRAVIHRNGRVEFDRDVFLVGDPYAGFELIATRHYDRFLLDAYRRGHDLRVGVLDLRRGRVEPVRRSRLFDPYDFDGFVPISLLPEDDGWLCDYGYGSVTAHYYGDDAGSYYGRPGGTLSYRSDVRPLHHAGDQTFRTSGGAEIRLKRDVEITRIE